MSNTTQPKNTLPATFSGVKALREFMSNYDGSWRQLAWEFNNQVSISTLRRINRGKYVPKKTEILKALRLPKTVTVQVCPHCGKPPLSKRHVCADAPKKPRPKRRNWRGLALTLAGVLVNQGRTLNVTHQIQSKPR